MVATVFGAAVAVACAWGPSTPTWALEKTLYDPSGNSAFLSPANDSRVNMMLLLADRRSAGLELLPAGKSAGLVLFPWDTLRGDRIVPPSDTPSEDSIGRCQSNAQGAEAFVAAVARARRLSAGEKSALIAARRALTECSSGEARPATVAVAPASAAGRAFARYLDGTRAFYRGNFSAAQSAFGELRNAGDPWLRETGLYMVARTALNGAQATIFDEYGSILPVEKRDRQAVIAADLAFQAYLKAYPRGQYAGSARGLLRRVYWLAGDNGRLSAAYGRIIRADAATSAANSDLSLVQEIDQKLFGQADPNARAQTSGISDAMLLAVDDLMRMRHGDDPECCTPISAEEIEAQRARFGAEVALFDYVRAAQAFFVRRDPAAVLRLIPETPSRQRYSSLEFSRQVLRGLALEASSKARARSQWVELLPGATAPYQNETVQLALATHEERSGSLEQVFAAGSAVTSPLIREVLLTYTAGPDLLRKQARDPAAPPREREVALYLLLSKGVQRGLYADFLRDARLIPATASNDPSFSLNDGSVDAFEYEASVPLSIFTRPQQLGDFGCPALAITVQALAVDHRANTPRICLAEFFRTNGFDHFAYDLPLQGRGLAGTTPRFPGAPYSRQSVYQAIIADPKATADERAYALYRAIRCYAPSGNNDCGGTDVEVGQRRAWFKRLKAAYPNSRWAKSSDLYW